MLFIENEVNKAKALVNFTKRLYQSGNFTLKLNRPTGKILVSKPAVLEKNTIRSFDSASSADSAVYRFNC